MFFYSFKQDKNDYEKKFINKQENILLLNFYYYYYFSSIFVSLFAFCRIKFDEHTKLFRIA